MCWRLLFSALGKYNDTTFMSPFLPPVYFNYWLATPQIFRQYCTLIAELKRLAVTESALNDCLYQKARYFGALPWYLKYVGHYTQHAFVFERVLPVFLFAERFDLGVLEPNQ